MKKKKTIIISVVAVALVVAVGITLAFEFFHIDFVQEKMGFIPPSDKIPEEYIVGGDGTEENPYQLSQNAYVISVRPRTSINDEDQEKVEFMCKIHDATTAVCEEYLYEFGLFTDVSCKFVKGSPNTLTYKLCGAPNGEEYIVTINWKEKDNPSVTYEKQ